MYKIGDKVLIKDIEQFNLFKNFDKEYSKYCGKILTIKKWNYDGSYIMKEDDQLFFEDWMIEKVVKKSVDLADVLFKEDVGKIFYNKILGKVILIDVNDKNEFIVKKLDTSDNTKYTFNRHGLLITDYTDNREWFELWPNENTDDWKDFKVETDFERAVPKHGGYFYYIDVDGEIKSMESDCYDRKQHAMYNIRNYFLSKEWAMNSDLYKAYHKQ